MNQSLHIIVLAAGQGKRMRSSRPKVLQPLAGRPLLAHVLDTAQALEPDQIHVVFGHGGDQVRRCFEGQPQLSWAHQAEQLGTGHAVQTALDQVPDTARVLVLLGDAPLVRPQSLRRLLDQDQQPVAVLTARVSDPQGYGRIVRASDGLLSAIIEERDADEATRRIDEVNSGMLCAPAKALKEWLSRVGRDNAQGEIYLTDIVALARSDGQGVAGCAAEEATEILGANDRRQLAELERVYQARRVDELCAAGAIVADPARLDLRGAVSVGEDVFLDINTVFEGDNQLGDRVEIGPNCVLRDCRLGPGTRVLSHCVLEGVETDGDCDIGPFARLRPGTRLAAHTRVGNFVETKKAQLGEGSKANHLSYLGDATVGKNVNIGAGTITCNYDGANKHHTTIGDGAFIGSDSQLVAPVDVGAGATIGAGSTITRRAPEDELTVGRARQVTVKGWKRPVKSGK